MISDVLPEISKRPSKKHGQNFLNDPSICKRIAEEVNLDPGSEVLEIGPGLGILTVALLKAGYRVKALEIDPNLVELLRSKYFSEYGELLEIIEVDALRYLSEKDSTTIDCIVSNLPYNISSSFMGHLLDSVKISGGKERFSQAIIMFQKEFGERLVARFENKKYGKISVMFQLKMDYDVLFKVPRKKFYPQPKVDGIVIKFRPKKAMTYTVRDENVLRNLVTVSFMNRRKMLKNSLNPRSLDLDISDGKIMEVLAIMDLSWKRPETVEPVGFVELSNRLVDMAR